MKKIVGLFVFLLIGLWLSPLSYAQDDLCNYIPDLKIFLDEVEGINADLDAELAKKKKQEDSEPQTFMLDFYKDRLVDVYEKFKAAHDPYFFSEYTKKLHLAALNCVHSRIESLQELNTVEDFGDLLEVQTKRARYEDLMLRLRMVDLEQAEEKCFAPSVVCSPEPNKKTMCKYLLELERFLWAIEDSQKAIAFESMGVATQSLKALQKDMAQMPSFEETLKAKEEGRDIEFLPESDALKTVGQIQSVLTEQRGKVEDLMISFEARVGLESLDCHTQKVHQAALKCGSAYANMLNAMDGYLNTDNEFKKQVQQRKKDEYAYRFGDLHARLTLVDIEEMHEKCRKPAIYAFLKMILFFAAIFVVWKLFFSPKT